MSSMAHSAMRVNASFSTVKTVRLLFNLDVETKSPDDIGAGQKINIISSC